MADGTLVAFRCVEVKQEPGVKGRAIVVVSVYVQRQFVSSIFSFFVRQSLER
jgi:hypothetical protein